MDSVFENIQKLYQIYNEEGIPLMGRIMSLRDEEAVALYDEILPMFNLPVFNTDEEKINMFRGSKVLGIEILLYRDAH